jgi:hypothetical protein
VDADATASYAEISPSRTGCKIFGTRDIGTEKTKNLEIYSRGRFFTVTGEKLQSDHLVHLEAAATLAAKKESAIAADILPRQRNNGFYALACSLRGRDVPKADAWQALLVEAAKRAIKSLHADGSTPFDPDWVRKAAATPMRYVDNRASVQAVRKAQMRPLPMYPSHNLPINEADIQRIIAEGKARMRKSGGGVSREKRRQIIDQVVRENPNCNTSSELSLLVARAISKRH